MPINAKSIMSAAFAGFVSAFAFMSLFGGGFLGGILGSLAALPLFYIAFSAGLLGTAIAAGLGFGLLALQTPTIVSAGFYLVGIGFAPLYLAWRLDRTQRYGPSGQLSGDFVGKQLGFIALIGGLIIAVAILNADSALAAQGGLTGVAKALVAAAVEQLAAGSQISNADLAALKAKAMSLGSSLFIGSGSFWLLIMSLNAALAALLARKAGTFGGAQISATALPRWFVFPAIGFVILSFSAGTPGLAIGILAITLLAAAALQGLAVVHTMSRGMAVRGVILTGIYAVCLLYNPAGILLAILGLVDSRLGLRHRGAS